MVNILKKVRFVGIFIIIVIWLLTGIYRLEQSEEAVVLTFGKHTNTIQTPGLHYHLPTPFQKVWIENVSEVKRIEYGFRTTKEGNKNEAPEFVDVPGEALMLTADENIVDMETAILFRVYDVEKFFFNVDNQLATLQLAGQSAIRRVAASNKLDAMLTENKSQIEIDTKAQLEKLIDKYDMGIVIEAVQLQDVEPPAEVKESFTDVTSAREKKETTINEARKEENKLIPEARGQAAEMINEAEAYKEDRIKRAKGDVAKFDEILKQYKVAKDITKERLYLEMAQEVFPGLEKYIVEGDGQMVEFLPLGKDKGVSKEEKGD